MSSIINFEVIKLAILRAASNIGLNNSDHNWNSPDKLDTLNNQWVQIILVSTLWVCATEYKVPVHAATFYCGSS